MSPQNSTFTAAVSPEKGPKASSKLFNSPRFLLSKESGSCIYK